ncbi:AEC family transporter [Pseudactinotalea sp. HY160]|nr:AEC family transporter [Pseudactinotalea sp. HY160]
MIERPAPHPEPARAPDLHPRRHMNGVVTGFATIVAVIAVGYLAARRGIVPGDGDRLLARISFSIAMPALLFLTLMDADPARVFSPLLVGILVSSLAMALVYLLLARLRRRQPLGDLIIGALSSSYVNAGNLGIPIAAYVLGDASYVAPVLFTQLLVLAPISLTILDLTTAATLTPRSWLRPLLNPIILASAAGLALGATGWRLPAVIHDPISLLAGAAVPLALLTYGISLWGSGGLRGVRPSAEMGLGTTLKAVVHPAFAYCLGRFVLHLEAPDLFALTVLAALPTAQNVYVYALRYSTGVALARSTILVTTALSIGVVTAIAAFLG